MGQQLSPALEAYVGAIHALQRERPYARVRDVAARLNVAKSAVTAAMQSLSEKGLVDYEPYEPVTLTAAGRDVGEAVALRHRVLADFLERVLGVASQRAESAACSMEHSVDHDVLEHFVCFLAYIGTASEDSEVWLAQFRDFLQRDDRKEACAAYMRAYVKQQESTPCRT